MVDEGNCTQCQIRCVFGTKTQNNLPVIYINLKLNALKAAIKHGKLHILEFTWVKVSTIMIINCYMYM